MVFCYREVSGKIVVIRYNKKHHRSIKKGAIWDGQMICIPLDILQSMVA